MRDADALITRTRTRCDKVLLGESKCRFIATATIGTDHIDIDYCRSKGIKVVNAPGCNAPAVAQYVLSSIISWRQVRNDNRPFGSLTIGIVGVGHVGSIVADWAKQLGMKVLMCDPPRAKVECSGNFVSLEDIARGSDIITFHTPLTRDGEYPTYNICGSRFLKTVCRKPLIINSARGAIIDTASLIDALDRGLVADAVIDCWEGEPVISEELLKRAVVATPHIAGYSREGKVRATSMALNAFTSHFGLPSVCMPETVADGAADSVTQESIITSYNPLTDTDALKSDVTAFEALRNNYCYRDEVK